MTPERWEKIEQLFQAARQRDPSSRAAYLAEACHRWKKDWIIEFRCDDVETDFR